jgi:hypothetical protein
VYSSSSTEPKASPAVATLLDRALMLLARDAPDAHNELARRLGDGHVRICIDAEVFDVECVNGSVRVFAPHGAPSVVVETTRAVVHEVLGGQRTIVTALHGDELRARGSLRNLITVLTALEAFVHGAVRSGAVAELFDDFQSERVA